MKLVGATTATNRDSLWAMADLGYTEREGEVLLAIAALSEELAPWLPTTHELAGRTKLAVCTTKYHLAHLERAGYVMIRPLRPGVALTKKGWQAVARLRKERAA